MKKDDGSIIRMFPVIISIMAVAVMLVFYAGWMANVTKKDEIRQVARSCMLEMEAKGKLDDIMADSLRTNLMSKGLENIDLSGSTTSDVGYGNAIFLYIKGDLRIATYRTVGFLRLTRSTTTIPVTVTLESTAKN